MGAFSQVLQAVKDAGEDFEWYPTSPRMIDVVARHLDKTAGSIMDVGAGDGRVLVRLAESFEKPPSLYAIEKSAILVQVQPEDVIPVGTDLFEQDLTSLPVDYIYSNPPYSEFETWASLIIESGHARKAFLVIPQRWRENAGIQLSLKKRGATARVLHSDAFFDAPRQARAVVDIVEVSFPKKESGRGYWNREPIDPFDIWFDEHISTFDGEEQVSEQQAGTVISRIREMNSIGDMVDSYREEYERMETNYRAIFQLDYSLLRELGVNKAAVREGIKLKISGLKARYWNVLFERLKAITDRLSTATKVKFLERLTGRVGLAFTSSNAYAVVGWAIKNANRYFNEQTVQLYRDLSTFEGVMNYKSNVKTWSRDSWRYCRHGEEEEKPSRYALDYRIVVSRWNAIGDKNMWEYPGGLNKRCHEQIADVIAVLYNLGFPSQGENSLARTWVSGAWQNWHMVGTRSKEILFQAKAHKNGNVHYRFLPEAMRALNVEAGRLLGWLRSPEDVVSELGYARAEAEHLYSCTKVIALGNTQLLLGSGGEGWDHDSASQPDEEPKS